MARNTPFVFCRYRIFIGEQSLNVQGQSQFLQEVQGNEMPYGRRRDDRPQSSALVMMPSQFEANGEICLTWSVGIRAGVRVQNSYDSSAMEITEALINDPHIDFTRILALPRHGVMAIEDRSSGGHISAKQAISAFRTVVFHAHPGEGSFEISHGNPQDIKRWLDEWDLKEYSYTISPLNPISASDLAEKRSDAMKQENIARDLGKVQPPEGQSMQPAGGIIEETNELVEVGYGQRGFRGRTTDGHLAHVQKPKFFDDQHKNLEEQLKQQFVRVLFGTDDFDQPLDHQIVSALRSFYVD